MDITNPDRLCPPENPSVCKILMVECLRHCKVTTGCRYQCQAHGYQRRTDFLFCSVTNMLLRFLYRLEFLLLWRRPYLPSEGRRLLKHMHPPTFRQSDRRSRKYQVLWKGLCSVRTVAVLALFCSDLATRLSLGNNDRAAGTPLLCRT